MRIFASDGNFLVLEKERGWMEEEEENEEEKRSEAKQIDKLREYNLSCTIRFDLANSRSSMFRNRRSHDDENREQKEKKKEREREITQVYSTYIPRAEKSRRIFGKSKTKHDRIVNFPFASRPFVRSFVRQFTTLENLVAYYRFSFQQTTFFPRHRSDRSSSFTS